MPVRNPFSRAPLSLVLGLSLVALLASSTQAVSPIGAAWSVEQIRSSAAEGDMVTLQGHVVSIREERFFTLEDTAGGQIITDIPQHLQRELGTPEKGETIGVRGKYDHKTLLDEEASRTSDPEKTWGIRVSALDRNIETSGRNPHAPDSGPVKPAATSLSAPAAPVTAVTIATPNTPDHLKARLTAARQKALAARDELGDANESHARGLYKKLDGAEMTGLGANQKRAQGNYDEAISAIGPLVDEARESGLDPKLIELYEAGITGPPR
jgi:uncharacterized protein YdeI (BOF family)